MSLRLVVTATAALAFASPAFAQDTPTTPPPAAAPQDAKSPEALAFEAKAEAFGARMTQFQTELEAVIAAAGGDQVKGMAEVEIILARYQPEIDAFAPELEAFFDSQIAAAPDDAQRQALTDAKAANSKGLRGMAAHVRTVAPEFITAAVTTPAATPAGAQ